MVPVHYTPAPPTASHCAASNALASPAVSAIGMVRVSASQRCFYGSGGRPFSRLKAFVVSSCYPPLSSADAPRPSRPKSVQTTMSLISSSRANIIRVPAAALLPGALRQQAAGLRACARHHHEVHSGSRTARQGRVARTARHGGSPERRGRVSPHIGFIHADERRRQRFSRDRALTGSARWWSHGRAAQNIVPLTAVARFELYPCMNNICMPRLPMSRSRIAATVAGCVTQAAVPDACART